MKQRTRYTVRILYKSGRDETSAPLTKQLAKWFAAMMRASHCDIISLEVTRVCVSL